MIESGAAKHLCGCREKGSEIYYIKAVAMDLFNEQLPPARLTKIYLILRVLGIIYYMFLDTERASTSNLMRQVFLPYFFVYFIVCLSFIYNMLLSKLQFGHCARLLIIQSVCKCGSQNGGQAKVHENKSYRNY